MLLVWLYYAAQIFLFGAELTKAYANEFGSRVVPKANAEPVSAATRAKQGMTSSEDKESPVSAYAGKH